MTSEPQLTPELDAPTETLETRVRRLLAVPLRLVAAVFHPDRGMERAVKSERSFAPVFVLLACALFSAWVVGSRIDVTSTILAEEAQASMGGGELRSDRDIAEQIVKQTKITQVNLGLAAGFGTILWLLAGAAGIGFVGWFCGGKPKFGRVLAAAAHAKLPYAVKSLVVAATAWPSTTLTPADIESLQHTLVLPKLPVPLFFTLDVFAIWSLVLVGFGMAAAVGISRKRAFVALLVSYSMLSLFLGSMVGGPPAGGPRPGMGPGGPR